MYHHHAHVMWQQDDRRLAAAAERRRSNLEAVERTGARAASTDQPSAILDTAAPPIEASSPAVTPAPADSAPVLVRS
jgi:hypothetical protein